MQYSYGFDERMQQEWHWTERYAAQPEILRYIEHVADRFDLRRDIQLGTQVAAAHFDEAAGRWLIETEQGERVSARFCIMATGCLSTPHLPALPGLAEFAGAWYHTARWPHAGVDFTDQRVGVIGTGLMGTACGRRLLAAGFDVVGYDVDPAKLEPLAALGARVARSLAEVARACDRAVLAVFNTDQVEQALEGADGLAASRPSGSSPLVAICVSTSTTARRTYSDSSASMDRSCGTAAASARATKKSTAADCTM